MNAGQLAYTNIDRFGEYTGLYFEGRSYTNLERVDYAQRLAATFREYGVRPGDRVVVTMPNCPEVSSASQAAWILGAVIMPVMPQLLARELRYMVEHAEARLVLTLPELASKVAEAV